MSASFRILAINPGSTSTKIAFFQNENQIFMASISHSEQEIGRFRSISDQHSFRASVIEEELKKHSIDLDSIDVVVGRGGLIRPIPSGTYEVNTTMLADLKKAEWGEHASNLGGILAHDVAQKRKIPSFIVDPVVVDEMDPVARLSGIPEIERRSIFHALNQKAVARKASEELGQPYEKVNLIVAHMGGGISVGAHCRGRVVDVNNALDGDGPFSPERAGGVPSGQLIALCYSGKYTHAEIKKHLVGKGGLVAYLGTNDARKIEEEAKNNNSRAAIIYQAMAYQVAKEIGLCATVLSGKVDGIVLTGGLAKDQTFVDLIRTRVEWISRLFIYPGEEEMQALALGALRVMRGEEKAKEYSFE